MALPKIDVPTYEMKVPSTDKIITVRPFSVKEEKLLLIALESQDQNEVINTVKQVVNNCIVSGDFNVDVLYTSLPILATFCYGMSTNLMKQKLQSQNPIYTTSLAMMMIGIPALCGLFLTDAPTKILATGFSLSLLSILFLAIFGTLIAWMLF